MSASVGGASSSKDMGLDEKKVSGTPEENGDSGAPAENFNGEEERLDRQTSEVSYAEEEDDDEDKRTAIVLGPQITLKEHMEKDKDDESLRRWKEQLLGSVDMESVGEKLEAEVKIFGISILSPDRPELVLEVPVVPQPKGLLFTLKEGSRYSLKFSFLVSHNIVSGLTYTNTVWKTGMKVDSTKQMLGTFSPQSEPYVHEMEEETTPSGMFARGAYSARTKFIDDDDKCYLEMNYTFGIRKDWASTS
ncbi:rho GDP-dissociation inhibitor 1-like [Magnolia sinica]|uniref:rho GDP-dissociation inhibitor 1-like n=1 Tax=Magnolia sinica TaxID=86752 RepID=UPI002659ED28|nr:rho GDP-dissociation inhibitor 1-like [Magnolia sinica]